MERILLTLEPVTAAFVHVEPEGDARWRAAPFRGLARWWFRAMVAAAVGPDEVRTREERLFGSAATPSAVIVRVRDCVNTTRQFRINPTRRSNDADRTKRYTATRSALVPVGARVEGARVEIELCPPNAGAPSEPVRQAYAALWVALHFGGVGQRARRGAGSLRMRAVRGVDELLPIEVADAGSYAAALSNGLREARRMLGVPQLRSLGRETEFPVFHPECASVWVVSGRGLTDETEVRAYLMDVRRELPSHAQSGHQEPEFGFAGRTRLASPVWIRVADFNRERTLFVVTLFRHRRRGVSIRPRWSNVEEEFVSRLGTESVQVRL
ncbi:MAG TPA: type III-B CRISPR module RAMP protein Cmr1 [Thermodesulfobacteriota bacterium]|nr:type III-B CRISPR module RAMP protein Cmr1 [Thermodesulfobacteriota bacterium]